MKTIVTGFSLITIGVALLDIRSGRAATCTWTGTVSQEWSEPGNWNPPGPPGTDDTALIGGGTAVVSTNTEIGALSLSGGQLTCVAQLTVLGSMTWTGGTLQGSGALLIASNAQLNIIGDGSHSLLVGTLQNLGTVRWSGNGSIGVSNQRPVILNSGLLEIQNDAAIGNGGSGGFLILTNLGTVRKSVATGISSFGSLQIVNQGTLDLQSGSVSVGGLLINRGLCTVQAGTLTLSAGGLNSSNIVLSASAVLDLSGGTFTNQSGGALTGSGTNLIRSRLQAEGDCRVDQLQLNNGTVDCQGSLTVQQVMNWPSGEVQGPGTLTIAANAQLNIIGDGSHGLLVGTLQNLGTVRWSGNGSIGVSNQRPVILNSGLLEIQNDAAIGNGGSGGFLILTNLGTVRKSVATGTSSFGSAQVVNQGLIELQSGSLSVGIGPLVQYAGATRLSGGTLTVPVGIEIRAGTLQGIGTVVANVTSAGSVEPGMPVGTLAITGIYTQQSAGALTVQLAGTAPGDFGQLRVSGQAALGGRLNARLVGGYSPGFGARFSCVSAAGIVGTFASYSSDPLPAGNFLTPNYSATGVDLVTLDATPEFVAAGVSTKGGPFTARLKGIANQPYAIEAATNMVAPALWTALATNIIPGSTFWDFVDPDRTNYACRFYRARHAP